MLMMLQVEPTHEECKIAELDINALSSSRES